MVESLKGPEPESIEEPWSLKVDLREFTEEDLFKFINRDLLEIENERYTGNTAEHKLFFLIGGPEKDVAVARTITGELVYTEPPTHPKTPEITEATAAISAYFEVKSNMPRVISEITDIFYNLSHLTVLDPKFADEYRDCMNSLSKSLGLPLHEALLLTALKYKHRHIDRNGEKFPEDEDKIIADRLEMVEKEGIIAAPSDDNITATYREINIMESEMLRPRLKQWRHTNKVTSSG